jgi:hypothetical protein
MDEPATSAPSCCHSAAACVFTKALLAHAAHCELAQRQSVGEADVLVCALPVARVNCGALAALMRERAAFALRLPRPPAPLVHAKALQLQCGGLTALRAQLQAPQADVHAMVSLAHECHGSLTDLPWQPIVLAMAAWQPRRRFRGPAP